MRREIKLLSTLGVATALTFAASSAIAVPLTPTVSFNNTTIFDAAGVTGFPTLGNQMLGIQVTANFVGGGTSGPISWVSTGSNGAANIGNSGGAFGTGWSLTLNGNSFSSGAQCPPFNTACGGNWVLSVGADSGQTIQSLTINLLTPGPTDFAFDVSPEGGVDGGLVYSPGSADGNAFGNRGNAGTLGATYFNAAPYTIIAYTSDGPAGLTIAATYSTPVRVAGLFYPDGGEMSGQGAITDLYAVLTLLFGGTSSGLAPGQTYTFKADTDQLIAMAVPEPMTLALFGTGLLGLGALRRFRRKPRK